MTDYSGVCPVDAIPRLRTEAPVVSARPTRHPLWTAAGRGLKAMVIAHFLWTHTRTSWVRVLPHQLTFGQCTPVQRPARFHATTLDIICDPRLRRPLAARAEGDAWLRSGHTVGARHPGHSFGIYCPARATSACSTRTIRKAHFGAIKWTQEFLCPATSFTIELGFPCRGRH